MCCTFGLYSAFLAWRAIVLRSSLQSKLTVATMFLECTSKRHVTAKTSEHDTYCNVGVKPLAPVFAAGVAAGVAGVTPVPLVDWCIPFMTSVCSLGRPSMTGGVNSCWLLGNEREPGAVKAFAWRAVEGCV